MAYGLLMLRLRQLQAFVAVAESEHFGRAAAGLGVSVGVVSRLVSRLERDLGLGLLRRTSRFVCLTSAGAALLDEAREVVAGARALEERAAAVGAGRRGVIRLGVQRGCEPHGRRLGEALRVPGWEVREQVLPRSEIGEGLHRGRIEVAVVSGSIGRRSQPWWRKPWLRPRQRLLARVIPDSTARVAWRASWRAPPLVAALAVVAARRSPP